MTSFRPSMERTALDISRLMYSMFLSLRSTPLVVIVKRKHLLCSSSMERAYSTVFFTVSMAISGSPPKKSTSMLRRWPDLAMTKSMARLAVSKSMVMRWPVPKSPVEAKQYLHRRLQSWETWRHRAFTRACCCMEAAFSRSM